MLDSGAKAAWREEMSSSFSKAGAIFVATYSGMTVEELTALRRELKKVEAEFHVVKNTIAKKAIAGSPTEPLGKMLKGQTGCVFAYGDVAAAAKAFSEAAKKNDKLKVVGGFMESNTLTASSVDQLASLPSKEVLLAKIIGSLVAPHRGLLGVMQGVPRAMVSVLNQIKEKKGEAAGA